MSRSLIQTTNQTTQTVAANGIISLGSVLRRFGCNCRLSGNAIEIAGEGYYTIDANVSVTPTAAGAVTVAIYDNGVQIPGAIAFTTGAAGVPEAIVIPTTVRQNCCCDGVDSITVVLIAGAGTVNNISVRVEKV
mgnify:CR=1 FL=1